ncbi:MAG: hypothetical protein ACXWE8_13165 [Solirubrobacterales bacterium]
MLSLPTRRLLDAEDLAQLGSVDRDEAATWLLRRNGIATASLRGSLAEETAGGVDAVMPASTTLALKTLAEGCGSYYHFQ